MKFFDSLISETEKLISAFEKKEFSKSGVELIKPNIVKTGVSDVNP